MRPCPFDVYVSAHLIFSKELVSKLHIIALPLDFHMTFIYYFFKTNKALLSRENQKS
jgi:hypothetical protein